MKPWISLLTAITLVTGLHQSAAQVIFAPAVTYGVATKGLAVADVNGDGKLDLIATTIGENLDTGTLCILTNTGKGSFVLAETAALAHGPGSIAVADINGDGKIDLIMANTDNNFGSTLSVWTNNGSGIFGSNTTYAVGTGPHCVVTADVFGDGKLALISADFAGNTLTVLTNNGSGLFGSNTTCAVGSGPASVAAADVNGDGHVDLIAANFYDNTLMVLTNNGSGVFGSNATYAVGSEPYSVAAADVNGDGKVDLISANYGGNTLTVLTNNGSGVFGSNATYVVGTTPAFVTVGDVNGDGKLDLISANLFDHSDVGSLSVLTNNGNGGFVTALTLGTGGLGENQPYAVAAADLHGNGKLDLVCVNLGADNIAVLTNNTIFPQPTFTPPLNINGQGNQVRVSWPTDSTGWSLQQNPNLATTPWGPSGYSGYGIVGDGTNNSLTMPPASGNFFFRLIHP